MRVFYQLAQYISHVRAGQANIRALRASGHELVERPEQADVAVLHEEPPYLAPHLERVRAVPGLPVVAYCVFEMSPLPEAFAAPLGRVDEIWTCSGFSRSILGERFGNVHVVPHVVERPRPEKADLARVAGLLAAEPHAFRFYTVADGVNQRKNLAAALRSFGVLRRSLGRKVAFVVKQYRQSLDLSGLPGVIGLDQDFSDGEMAALHALCHCYVSPHRAEAWGLGLSEALAMGRQVLATGYSGNMEYMDETNSRLLPYVLGRVSSENLAGLPPFFSAGMSWAEVDESALLAEMRRAVRGQDPEQARRAQAVAARFSPARVGAIMTARLHALAGHKGPGGAA
ncbi:MAG: hypothetical protein V3573_00850 [Desulfovibrionaceae bacterium]